MRPLIFNEADIPMSVLEAIGLASGKQLLLNAQDLRALLSGARTGMQQLHDLHDESGIHIQKMDAKISLRKGEDGQTELLIHPIYRKPKPPSFLYDIEAEMLERKEVPNVLKEIDGREILVEYDADTREFIVSNTAFIFAPEMVNGEQLTESQKQRYRKGKEVELADGTVFNYSAAESHGVRSNKLAIVASVLIDGGISYLVFKGLNALFNQKHDTDSAKQSPGYLQAMTEVENQPDLTQHFDRQNSRSRK